MKKTFIISLIAAFVTLYAGAIYAADYWSYTYGGSLDDGASLKSSEA